MPPRVVSPSVRAARQSSFDILPLFEFSNVVNSSLDLVFILDTVLLTVMGKLLVSKGLVLLRRDKNEFEVIAKKGVEQFQKSQRIAIERPITSMSLLKKVQSRNREWLAEMSSTGLELAVPIVSQKRIVGYVFVGSKLSGKKFSVGDKQLLHSLVNLSGSAVEKAVVIEQLKETNRKLDRKYQELNTLFDLSKEFNAGLDVTKVIRLMTFALLGQIGVHHYAICLKTDEGNQFIVSKLEHRLDLNESLQTFCDLKKAELIQDLLKQKKTREPAFALHQAGITALIPMHVQNQTKGLIMLGPRLKGEGYSAADLEFLYSMGNLAIISIENARLFKEALEKQRLEDELIIAREIQQGLLPEQLPVMSGFDIAGINIPSLQVGGDYYDVIQHSENDFVVAIGDVSGKGTPAALLMAGVQAVLRTIAPLHLPLPEATGRMNELICLNTHGGKFITFFWGVLETKTATLHYINAGHNPPMLIRKNGSVEKLEDGGLILGIMKSVAPYKEGACRFERGDVLLMYTDGVSEAMNPENVDFSEDALERTVVNARNSSAKEIITAIQQALEKHTKGSPQSDDITMLVLKAL